jgi:hypothetical protein
LLTVDTKANFRNVAQGHDYLSTYTCPTSAPSSVVCFSQKLRRMVGPASIDSSLETEPQPALTTGNDTCTGYDACGMDLGISADHGGKTHWIFGDTFGSPGNATPPNFPDPVAPSGNRRCNTAAKSSDNSPEDGISFDASPNGMIKDPVTGKAITLVGTCGDAADPTATIPTAVVGGTTPDLLYMHYMEIDNWGWAGAWTTNLSNMATSTDGQSWTLVNPPMFSATSTFAQVAMEEFTNGGLEWTAIFGTPAGRYGGVRLAIALTDQLTDRSKWFYWRDDAGIDACAGAPTQCWSAQGASESVAIELIPGPVGEISVRYNANFGRWVMMYLDADRYAIVMRTAQNATGPWDDARIVAQGSSRFRLHDVFPYLAGGWMPENMPGRWGNPSLDGNIYFTVSEFVPYKVYWMKTSLNTIAY